MSLVNLALRLSLQRALLNRTLAEDRVNDSMVTPIPDLAGEAVKPIIVISTDDDDAMLSSFDLLDEKRDLSLVIEIVVAGTTQIEDGAVSLAIPHTDAGLELTLDFVQRGIFRALTDPGNPWAQIFLDLVGQPKRRLKRRGADTANGIRFAARQITLVCDPAYEPAYGKAPDAESVFGRFLAALREDGFADYADAIEREIVGTSLPSWQVTQATLGITTTVARILGFSPFDPAETGEPPELARVRADQHAADGSTLLTSTGDGAGVQFTRDPA